jgi:hypothetical protein
VVSAYTDADWANNKQDRKSVTGWVVKVNGDTISWCSKKQQNVARSTCEAELYAEAAGAQEVMWVRHLLEELELPVQPQSALYGDNQGTLLISENGVITPRTKHVDVQYHFVTDLIASDELRVQWVTTQRQQADLFTKALAKPTFIKHRDCIMARQTDSKDLTINQRDEEQKPGLVAATPERALQLTDRQLQARGGASEVQPQSGSSLGRGAPHSPHTHGALHPSAGGRSSAHGVRDVAVATCSSTSSHEPPTSQTSAADASMSQQRAAAAAAAALPHQRSVPISARSAAHQPPHPQRRSLGVQHRVV